MLINWGTKYTNSKPRIKVKKVANIRATFGRDAIELFLKIKIAIEDLIEQIKKLTDLKN